MLSTHKVKLASKRAVRMLIACMFFLCEFTNIVSYAPTVQASPHESPTASPLSRLNTDDVPPSAPAGYFVNSFFPSEAMKTVAGNLETIFLIHYNELSRSVNGGVSWSSSSFPDINDLVASPDFSRDQRVFVALRGSTNVIRLSSDGGQTWRASQAPLDAEVWELFVSPTFANDQTIYAIGTNSLMRSVDGGEHWENVSYPPLSGGSMVGALHLSPYFSDDRTLFALVPASFSRGQLWRSMDGGMTWQPIHNGMYLEAGNILRSAAVIALGGGEIALIAATRWGLLISFDFDGTWYVLSQNAIDRLIVPADFAWTGVMFAYNAYKNLYRTQDFGKTWQDIFPTTENYSSHSPVILSPDYIADRTLYMKTPYALWRSTDDGSTWNTLAENPPISNIGGINQQSFVFSPAFESDGTVFAVPFCVYECGLILKSTDAGRHWRALFLPAPSSQGVQNILVFSPAFAADHTVFIIFGSNMYRSTDGGESWSRIEGYNKIPLSYGSYPTKLTISPNYPQDNTLFVITPVEGLYRSTDGGNTWALLKANQGMLDFAISPGYPQDPTLYVLSSDGSHLFLDRSTDGGVTWQRLPFPQVNYYRIKLSLSPDFLNDGTLFVLSNPGIFRSTNRGESFEKVPGTEGASYFHLSPRYKTDRTWVTDLGITEDDGAHWFPLAQAFAIGGIGYWQNRLTMLMMHPGDVDYADPYEGLYYYRWPKLIPPPASINFGIDANEPAPVDVNVFLQTADDRPVPWLVEGRAPWLRLSTITGTMPSTLTLTADCGGETINVGSMNTSITLTLYLSYRLRRSYSISLEAFLVNARAYLPLVTRNYKPSSANSVLQASASRPMQEALTPSRLKSIPLVTFQKQK